jgi:hypothetical protein
MYSYGHVGLVNSCCSQRNFVRRASVWSWNGPYCSPRSRGLTNRVSSYEPSPSFPSLRSF